MNHTATFIILLLTAFSALQCSAKKLPGYTKEMAREAVEQVAEAISGSKGADKLKEKTGVEASISAKLSNDTMHIYLRDTDDFSPVSEQMAKLIFAAARSPREVNSSMSLADLLETAECCATYHYHYKSRPELTVTFTPESIRQLKTAPFNQLGLDRNRLIDEFVSMFNQELDTPEQLAENDLISFESSLDGKYIAFHYVFASPQEFLDDADNMDFKSLFVLGLLNEMGSTAVFVPRIADAGEMLGLAGLKFDFRDLSGRQQVISASWKELKKMSTGDTAETSRQYIETFLSTLDSGITESLAEEGLEWQQTHRMENNRVHIVINTRMPWHEIAEYDAFFQDENLLGLYAESMKMIAESMPTLEGLTVEVYGTDDPEPLEFHYSRSVIDSYVEPEEVPDMIDEKGHIRT